MVNQSIIKGTWSASSSINHNFALNGVIQECPSKYISCKPDVEYIFNAYSTGCEVKDEKILSIMGHTTQPSFDGSCEGNFIE